MNIFILSRPSPGPARPAHTRPRPGPSLMCFNFCQPRPGPGPQYVGPGPARPGLQNYVEAWPTAGPGLDPKPGPRRALMRTHTRTPTHMYTHTSLHAHTQAHAHRHIHAHKHMHDTLRYMCVGGCMCMPSPKPYVSMLVCLQASTVSVLQAGRIQSVTQT